MIDLQVGNKRKFTFSDKEYKIREIIDQPNIKLFWTYDSGVCPHCKKRITRNIEHDFYRIEILGDDSKEDDNSLLEEDIQIIGHTLDKRILVLPIDKYNEVFSKTKKFKKLIR